MKVKNVKESRKKELHLCLKSRDPHLVGGRSSVKTSSLRRGDGRGHVVCTSVLTDGVQRGDVNRIHHHLRFEL